MPQNTIQNEPRRNLYRLKYLSGAVLATAGAIGGMFGVNYLLGKSGAFYSSDILWFLTTLGGAAMGATLGIELNYGLSKALDRYQRKRVD